MFIVAIFMPPLIIPLAIAYAIDEIGDEIKNQQLSEERAKSVVNYLISKNVDKTRLSFKGMGSKQPILSNNTEEGRKKNRRVEFVQFN